MTDNNDSIGNLIQTLGSTAPSNSDSIENLIHEVNTSGLGQKENSGSSLNVSIRHGQGGVALDPFAKHEMPEVSTSQPNTTVALRDTGGAAPTEQDLKSNNELLQDKQDEETPSAVRVFAANFAPTFNAWWDSYKEDRMYPRDPTYKAEDAANLFFKEWGQMSEEENKYLNGSVSAADFEHRKARILDQREESVEAAKRPWITAAAGLVDVDIALALTPPLLAASRATKGAKVAARVAQGAGGAALAYGINEQLKDRDLRTDDERTMDSVIFGLVGVLTDPVRASRAAKNASKGGTSNNVPTGAVGGNTVVGGKQYINLPQNTNKGANVTAQGAVKLPPTKALPSGASQLPPHLQTNLSKAIDEELEGLRSVAVHSGTPSQILQKSNLASRMVSAADELAYYTQGDTSTVVNRLLVNVSTNGDNVASAQAAYLNNYGYLLSGVEKALADAVPELTQTSSNIWTRVSGQYVRSAQTVMDAFQDAMQRLDQDVMTYHSQHGVVPDRVALDGMIHNMNLHPSLKNVVSKYIDSGFAERIFDDAQTNGFFNQAGMENIVRRPTYMPLSHNYDRMHELVTTGKASWDDVYDFYGEQIVRIYPELLDPNFAKAGRSYKQVKAGAKTAVTNAYNLTIRQVGEHFVHTQKQNARGLSDVTTHGMSKETMHDMLTRAGVSSDEAATAVAKIFREGAYKQSNPKNFRKRMSWDWNMPIKSSTTGEVLRMIDFTGGSTMHNLENYSRRMAHLNGLAQYGLSEQSMRELLESYLDKLPRDVDVQKARNFFSNVADDLSGKPTGGGVSQSIRSAQAVADMMLLANSGLYGLMDVYTQTLKVGILRTFPHVFRGLKNAIMGMRAVRPDEAKDLADIFSGKLMNGSRWRNFPTHYADNYQISGGFHEGAQYYGQATRFVNLSEAVKRFQIGILSGMYLRAMRGAANGEIKHIKFLKNKLGMTDDLVNAISKEWATHGDKVDDWYKPTRILMEQKIFHEADNLAYTIQKGETPAILEYDGVGKVILPYMRYAFAMNQKVYRRTWNRDGAGALALLMVAQIPMAVMLAAAINVRRGEEPDKDLAVGAVRAMTAMGAWNYPLELLMGGFNNNSVTAMTPFSKTYNLVSDVLNGEATPRSIKQNSILNSMVFLDPVIHTFED